MNTPKKLVVDANILIRAVFGKQAFELLEAYEEVVEFYSPVFASKKREGMFCESPCSKMSLPHGPSQPWIKLSMA